MSKQGTITANGNVDVQAQSASARAGNITTIYASGTWGSGTLKVQSTPDGTNYFDVPDATLTADGQISIAVKTKNLRLVLSGATTPNINYWVM